MKDSKYSTQQYLDAFKSINVFPHQMRMLQAHYHALNRTVTATQMAKAVGYPKYTASNLHYGTLASHIGKLIGWQPLPKQAVFVLVTFGRPDGEWQWIMRPEVAQALEQLGWVDTELPVIPEEVDKATLFYEGSVRNITVNAYERNSAARERCILHYGCRCAVCDLKLSDKYGETAQGLIHVHHLQQLSDINAKYIVDPIKDLRPVCPTWGV